MLKMLKMHRFSLLFSIGPARSGIVLSSIHTPRVRRNVHNKNPSLTLSGKAFLLPAAKLNLSKALKQRVLIAR